MENISLVWNEYEIQIRHAKNTPMAWVFHWKHPWWSPTPTRSVLLCFRGLVLCFRYFTSLLRAQKGPFACVTCPFLLTRYFFTRDAKYPFYIRHMQVNACFYPPPFTPKHKPTSRVLCMPCVQSNMEAIAGIFLCIVPIIQSHVSKWYSNTKSPKYEQQNCKNLRQTWKKPYNFPCITLSQYFLALPYASCRVQEGCQTLSPLA